MNTIALVVFILLTSAPSRAAQGDCGQPVSSGALPVASDCLFILRAAVGSETCSPECTCNTNGAAGTTASDALVCLKKAVGQSVDLNCPCGSSPVGDQLQVNTYTTDDQRRPAVASDADGNFVVAWTSLGSSGTDSSGSSIQAQRFSNSGAPVGTEFQVNTFTSYQQSNVSVAADADGNFIVAWDNVGVDPDDALSGLRARRFDSSGAPIGTDFRVNTYTTGGQGGASVGFDDGGNFVIVWASYGSSGSDTSGSSIQGQRFDTNGDPAGTEFQINTYTTASQRNPAIAVASSGDFVVVWDNPESSDPVPAENVQGQRFDESGAAVGTEFIVNTYTTEDQGGADVAVDTSGSFVVVWNSYRSDESDDYNGIHARRFDENGNPIGTQFQVNSYTTGIQADMSVAAIEGGGFVVVWDTGDSSGPDSDYSIQGQLFDADGDFVGSEFQANASTTGYQFLAEVAPGANGGFVVVWESDGSAGSDSAGSSIQGQRFE